jgi:hypothetical protein
MASGQTSTTGSAFVKRYYSPSFVINTISKKESRLLNLINHDSSKPGGDSYNFLTMVGDNPSGSADFSQAQERGQNAGSSGFQFKVDWMNDFQAPSVSKEMIAKTRNQAGGWIPALKNEIDSALRYSAHRRSVALYTTGFGELGTVTNAIGAGFTITVGNPRTGAADRSCSFRFVKGMKLVFSQTIGASVLRAGQSAVVTKVDYVNGIITLDTALNAITGLTQNDVIFTKGDRQDSATPTRLRPPGLGFWCPTTAPGVGPDYGVDRSSNSFLYGWIIDGTASGKSLAQCLVEAANLCSTVGHAERLVAAVSVDKFIELSASMEDKQYTQITGRGGTGYKALVVYADGVELPVISDMYCPNSEAYVGNPDAFHHPSIGPAPHMDEADGNSVLRQSADAGLEARTEAFETMTLENGAQFSVIKLA